MIIPLLIQLKPNVPKPELFVSTTNTTFKSRRSTIEFHKGEVTEPIRTKRVVGFLVLIRENH